MRETEEKTLLFGGRLAVRLMEPFKEMDAKKAEAMYPYEARPMIILDDEASSRFCTFSLLKNQGLAGAQIENAIYSISRLMVSLYPSCLLIKPNRLKSEKGECGWFAFRTAGAEGELYHIMYIFPVDGCMMLGTMGCSMEDKKGKKQFLRIMESLEVPEKIPAYARQRGVISRADKPESREGGKDEKRTLR